MLHAHTLTRRGFCLCCLASATFAATGGWLTPREAFAQARNVVDQMRAEAGDATITVQKLRGNVSVLDGSGGNIAVLTGRDGKLLVDAGLTASRPQITERWPPRRRAGHAPDQHALALRPHRRQRVAARRRRDDRRPREHAQAPRLERQRVDDWDFTFPPSPAGAVPARSLRATEAPLELNGTTVALKYYGPAHTDSDLSVTLRRTPTSCTPATPTGTASTRSSTTRPAAASTA